MPAVSMFPCPAPGELERVALPEKVRGHPVRHRQRVAGFVCRTV